MGTHRVLTRYSRVLTRYCATPPSTRHSFVCLSQYLWDAAGSARQCGAPERRVRAAWHCRVLTGYSGVATGTQGYSLVLTRYRAPRRSGCGPTSLNIWQCVAPPGAAALRVRSNIWVLTRYSRVLPLLRTPPRTRNPFVFLLQYLWDASCSARQSGAHESMVCVVRHI
jgi:hypothetical protein